MLASPSECTVAFCLLLNSLLLKTLDVLVGEHRRQKLSCGKPTTTSQLVSMSATQLSQEPVLLKLSVTEGSPTAMH